MPSKFFKAIAVTSLSISMSLAASTGYAADSHSGGPKTGKIQAAGGFSLVAFDVTPSAGVLNRYKDGISFDGTFGGLAPDSAYSAWWVIFNKPELCASAICGESDVIAGVGQIFYAGGFLTNSDGEGDMNAELRRGRIPKGADRFSEFVPIIDPESETGLRRPLSAQVGVVARFHGETDPAIVGDQIGGYLGGCDVVGVDCVDEQIIVFTPN